MFRKIVIFISIIIHSDAVQQSCLTMCLFLLTEHLSVQSNATLKLCATTEQIFKRQPLYTYSAFATMTDESIFTVWIV